MILILALMSHSGFLTQDVFYLLLYLFYVVVLLQLEVDCNVVGFNVHNLKLIGTFEKM